MVGVFVEFSLPGCICLHHV